MLEKYDVREVSRNQLDNAIIVMSNIIARTQTLFTVRETKLFLTALSQIKTRDQDNWVTLTKADVIKKLEMDPNDVSKLRSMFESVAKKSWVKFNGESEEEWEDGFMVIKSRSTKKTVSLQFDKDYIPLLDQLETHFTKVYLDNITHFASKKTIALYLNLRSWYDRNYMITHKRYSLTELKEIFELDENAYMVKRKDKKTNKVSVTFDIYNFEKHVLKKAIEEINEDPTKSGMYVAYEKLKTNGDKGFVTGYDFAISLVDKDGTRKFNEIE